MKVAHMSWLLIVGVGLVHFLIGGLWYSPLLFSRPWMRGLGITDKDIAEARINVPAAIVVSAILSFVQVLVLAWLLDLMLEPSVATAALMGAVLGIAFSTLPMIKDHVWADRPLSVILIDGGYEIFAGAGAAALLVAFAVGA